MKIRFLKSAVVLLLACTLVFSLTGCDGLDYREAIDLYNNGQYDKAAEMFAALGDHEDSIAMHTRSQYWAAITLMEQGDFQQALPRFIKLGNFEDSAQRATECNYQIAIAAFEAGNLTDAETQFQELADYRLSREYLRRINWQKFYEAISAVGFDNVSGFTIEKEIDGKLFSISAVHHDHATQELLLSVSSGANDAFFFSDGLAITLTRDSTAATFAGHSGFGMDFGDGRIGSTQSASGKLDITTCTPETELVVETFEKHVDDNQGNASDSTDPADSLMNETMAENMHDLMTVIPELLLEAGIELTLQDIGFDAL